jgi:hypothetical protein
VNQRQQNNTNAVVKLAAELGRGNGDPGGEDQFDGGCPSDTIASVVTEPMAPISHDRKTWYIGLIDYGPQSTTSPTTSVTFESETLANAWAEKKRRDDIENGYVKYSWRYLIVKVVLP